MSLVYAIRECPTEPWQVMPADAALQAQRCHHYQLFRGTLLQMQIDNARLLGPEMVRKPVTTGDRRGLGRWRRERRCIAATSGRAEVVR